MPQRDRWRLEDWLRWQEGLSPVEINPGLERVQAVGERLGALTPRCPVITVAGTNGKGSCIAYLEAMLGAAGYRTAAYTSPHLLRYNERIRLAGVPVSDEAITAAFSRVEQARQGTPLTYFEYGTLAALSLFSEAEAEVWLLEVGMGGRLDAVNAVDPDLSIITSIGLDHTEWLGADRERIGAEKAGIMRPGRPVCLGQADLPDSVSDRARTLRAPVTAAGRDFHWRRQALGWDWLSGDERLDGLPWPGLTGTVQLDNAAVVIAGLRRLRERLPVDRAALERGLRSARLPGHMERVRRRGVEWLFDVAHNEDSVRVLAETVRDEAGKGRVIGLFAAMHRKALSGVLATMGAVVDEWYLPRLEDPQAHPPEAVAAGLRETGVDASVIHTGGLSALLAAVADRARPGDRVVVFGSFRTVEAVMRAGGRVD
ncbi:bifunctional tetrahydrofolate synthase/dihydrofolate synthase [Alkalilimnicola ehrlichii MLHE-1]|nr:bifunctional tetrahydrofolate synthase/dihydrofolate synthase [Alkalilimnicola ehrlichii]